MSGISYSIPCPSCGKIHEITYGSSVVCTYHTLTVSSLHHGGRPLLEYLVSSKKILKETFRHLEDGYSLDPGYGYQMYFCGKCRRLFVRFDYSLSKDREDSTTDTYRPDYRCWKCKCKISCILQDEIENLNVTCNCGQDFKIHLNDDPNPEEWS